MKPSKKSLSEKFVAAVVSFVTGSRMHGQERTSTYSLLKESRQLSREVKELDRLCEKIFGPK